MVRLGVHISIAKGLINALCEAKDLGCNAMQIFIRSPRGFGEKKLDIKEVKSFNSAREKMDIRPLVVHGSYLLNIASSDRSIRNKSLSAIKDDLALADQVNSELYVLHFGSNSDRGEGIKIMQDSLAEIKKNYKGKAIIILENTAGEGNKLGFNIADIGECLTAFDDRFGVCLDSAHLFSAGVDLRNKDKMDSFIDAFDKKIGIKRVKLVHINDSLYDLGQRRDRHEHIGEGCITDKGIKNFIKHPKISEIPAILETPKDKEKDDIKNINRVKYIRSKKLKVKS